MNALKKVWKLLAALVLLVAAALIVVLEYLPAKMAYETRMASIENSIRILNETISENKRYAAIQDSLGSAEAQLTESRQGLYQLFPAELREEDQIMYILYLEEQFGTEIHFSFATAQPITKLYDGAILAGVTLTVNYETTYQGFKDMVNYLATDSRITSVQYATVDYDAELDQATGTVTLLVYVMETDLLEYLPPEIEAPDVGKENLFGDAESNDDSGASVDAETTEDPESTGNTN